MRYAPFILPAALVLAACAGSPEAPEAVTTVEVSALYRERIMLPPGHTLTVRVEDVSRTDAAAEVLAERRMPLDGGPPYAVSLSVPTARIDPRHTYAARAEIRDPAGALRFTTDTRHAVLTQGAPKRVEIILVGVR